MKINWDNYEKYLIDYLDGTLSESISRELRIFLGQHPDLRMEMEGLDDCRLEPADASYCGKELLKKNLFSVIQNKQMSYDEVCVASMEGDLDSNDQELLLSYINEDPVRQKEHALLNKTILEPDLSIVFENKNRLKKPVFIGSRRMIYTIISAAAAILVLLFLIFRPGTAPLPDMISDDSQGYAGEKTEQIRLQKLTAISPASIMSQQVQVVPENRVILRPALPAGKSIEKISLTAIPTKHGVSLNHTQKEYYAIRSYTKYNNLFNDYQTPNEYLAGLIRKTITGDDDSGKEEKLAFRDLADAGIQKLEELTANNYELSRSYNSEGNVQRFTLETAFFGISALCGSWWLFPAILGDLGEFWSFYGHFWPFFGHFWPF